MADRERPPFYRGSPEEQYLRNRSSYLAPGALGKITFVWRVVLGVVFNLVVLSLLLVPVGYILGALYRGAFPGLRARTMPGGSRCDELVAGCVFNAWPNDQTTLAVAATAILGVLLGLFSVTWRFKKDRRRAIVQSWSLRLVSLAGLGFLLVALLPVTLAALRNLSGLTTVNVVTGAQVTAVGAVGGTSLATVLLGVLLHLRARIAEPATVLQTAAGIKTWFAKLSTGARKIFTYLAGAVAGPLLLLAIVVGSAMLAVRASGTMWRDWALLLCALVLFMFLFFRADLTTWSLHPFYRRRLAAAFALKRVEVETDLLPPRIEARERDYNNLVKLSETKVTLQGGWPTLIVCAAANISDPGATPPGRGVTSFTFSPYAIGGPLVGGVPTSQFEGSISKKRHRDFTLIAAVAMSGAALSPSMGKMTRRPLTFLMALANVRLGVWVPNPRRIEHWLKEGSISSGTKEVWMPRPGLAYLARELVGLNRVNDKFLYVTDGAHYENLGLVELLRRGCTRIYCFDASGGTPGAFPTLATRWLSRGASWACT